VRPGAEGEVPRALALEAEALAVGEDALVAVGRRQQEEDDRACGDARAAELDLGGRAAQDALHGGVEAQRLLDEGGDEREVRLRARQGRAVGKERSLRRPPRERIWA
jgi:hypothetical protein